MPIPKPKAGEKQDDFISRCHSAMEDEFPDQKQRTAVCFNAWRKAKSGKKSANTEIETRTFPLTEFRVNRGVDGNADKLVGYPAVFDRLSDDLGGFKEKIRAGAFKKSLKNADVRALKNHDQNYVLGRTTSETLKLKEDKNGLYAEIIPPDAQWARDLLVSVERGDISQMSFGFKTISDSWEKRDDENIRTLEEVDLFDVSVVTFPAYKDTNVSVALRSMEEWREKENPEPSDETIEEEPAEENETVEPDAEELKNAEIKRKQEMELAKKVLDKLTKEINDNG